MASILLLDDQPDVRRLLATALQREGHQVHEASDGAQALAAFDAAPVVDLVLLDIEVPGGVNGLEVLRRLHAKGDVPVILVTGRGDEPDRIVGLRMGAEDYVVKPFSVNELMARVANVLRRRPPIAVAASVPVEPEPAAAPEGVGTVTAGPITLDTRRREVEVRGAPVQLTHREFELLEHLARAPMAVFSRDELLRDIWRSKSEWQDPATVTEHVRRLRSKLEVDPARPRLIQTVRGAGYRLVPAAG